MHFCCAQNPKMFCSLPVYYNLLISKLFFLTFNRLSDTIIKTKF